LAVAIPVRRLTGYLFPHPRTNRSEQRMPSLIFFPPFRSVLAVAFCAVHRMLHIPWPDNRLAAPRLGIHFPQDQLAWALDGLLH
jgi:hypothetical protein